MKSFSIALLFALLQQDCQGFVTPTRTAIHVRQQQQHQPLFISTELTAESSAASSSDDEIKTIEIPTVEGAATEDAAPAAEASSASDDAAADKPEEEEVPRHTLFVGNIPFGTFLTT